MRDIQHDARKFHQLMKCHEKMLTKVTECSNRLHSQVGMYDVRQLLQFHNRKIGVYQLRLIQLRIHFHRSSFAYRATLMQKQLAELILSRMTGQPTSPENPPFDENPVLHLENSSDDDVSSYHDPDFDSESSD